MNRRMPNGTSVWCGRTAGVTPLDGKHPNLPRSDCIDTVRGGRLTPTGLDNGPQYGLEARSAKAAADAGMVGAEDQFSSIIYCPTKRRALLQNQHSGSVEGFRSL